MRIGICDDIREEVEKQEKQVRQITYQIGIRADIRKCYSGMDLLMEIELSGQFDIILLDIELGGMNGIETARQIRESDVNCNIIFITSFEQYSKEAISVHPLHLLINLLHMHKWKSLSVMFTKNYRLMINLPLNLTKHTTILV